jgi:simple sugar transport system permease protein
MRAAESLALALLALAGGLLLFGGFVALGGHSPLQAWTLLFRGAFGDAFSLQNTLVRAAPLMLEHERDVPRHAVQTEGFVRVWIG